MNPLDVLSFTAFFATVPGLPVFIFILAHWV